MLFLTNHISDCFMLCISVCSSASHFTEFFSYLPNICSLHISKVRKHWYYLSFFNSWVLLLGISTLISCFSWDLMCWQFYVGTVTLRIKMNQNRQTWQVHGKGKVPRHALGSGGPVWLLFLKKSNLFFAPFFKILKPQTFNEINEDFAWLGSIISDPHFILYWLNLKYCNTVFFSVLSKASCMLCKWHMTSFLKALSLELSYFKILKKLRMYSNIKGNLLTILLWLIFFRISCCLLS